MLLSAGLLRVIPEQSWADCADRLVCGSSDFRLATCVRHLAGVELAFGPDAFEWVGGGWSMALRDIARAFTNFCRRTLLWSPPRGRAPGGPDCSPRDVEALVLCPPGSPRSIAARHQLLRAATHPDRLPGGAPPRRDSSTQAASVFGRHKAFHGGSLSLVCLLWEALSGNSSCAHWLEAQQLDRVHSTAPELRSSARTQQTQAVQCDTVRDV